MYTMDENDFAELRQQMLAEIATDAVLLSERLGKIEFGERVMQVMGMVPRHWFVPFELQPLAYLNRPLPIGFGKTISQPFIVALMTDLLQIDENDVILEVGTGLGYQSAILSALGKSVYSVEIIEQLAQQAVRRLGQLGCTNVEVKVANGCQGWPAHAPFDKVIVTAAPDLIPAPLIHQLKPGGRMVIPAGLPGNQSLVLVEKNAQGSVTTRQILPVVFSQIEDSEPVSDRA